MLIVHNTTQALIDTFEVQRAQAILLTGQSGVGLSTIALSIAKESLSQLVEPMSTKGEIDHATGTISVEVIRALYQHTRSKHLGHRTILIDDADRMSVAAQNAFLKLLEEPNDSTTFILTSHQPKQLLPTIISRVQSYDVLNISPQQTDSLLDSLEIQSPTLRAQYRFIALGLPAEIMRLYTDENYRMRKVAMMGDAKKFLEGSSYDRLKLVNTYSSDKKLALEFLDSAISILKQTLVANSELSIVSRLSTLADTVEKIHLNANIKLQLMRNVL